jgi:tRNA threonylcarbamoyl adenosine modification protein (Sua5/YciO/YrdC/YwlC family)
LSDYAKQVDTSTFKILKRALPGPYTFILPGSSNLPKEFKRKATVGIRIPDNNIIREIVRLLGNPIVSTSIYDEDEILEYSTDPELIFEKWQDKVDLVIDGGYGDNTPSTIIDLTGNEPEVIREGKGSLDVL